MENTKYSEFREYLKAELTRRCNNNPSYSMRAFARSLDVDQSFLLKVLKGEKGLSDKSVWKIGQRIGIKSETLVAWTSPIQNRAKPKFYFLDDEYLKSLTEWYHFAILELTQLPSFQPQAKWIAKKLGLTVSEVNIAIDRLTASGRLTIDENGNWQLKQVSTNWVNFKHSSEVRKRIQKQFLQRGLDAIDQVPLEQPENASLTLAIDSSLIPLIKKRIDDFKNSLMAEVEEHKSYDSVHQICIAFFPLSKGDLK